MESRSRKPQTTSAGLKSSPLPVDFLKMVTEVFSTNFDRGLTALNAIKSSTHFEAHGEILPNEIVLGVSIVHPGQLAATTVYASTDFDPKASSPTAEDLLSACVDAIGTLMEQLLHPDRLEQVTDESLSAMENVPFDWTEAEVDKYRVYLKVDKANPSLEHLADEWLLKNDPQTLAEREREEKETQSLFITGPKKPGPGDTVH
jgi:hypothetical protein